MEKGEAWRVKDVTGFSGWVRVTKTEATGILRKKQSQSFEISIYVYS